jgi:hypothetical protein
MLVASAAEFRKEAQGLLAEATQVMGRSSVDFTEPKDQMEFVQHAQTEAVVQALLSISAAISELSGGTVEIGGQVMTEAQFNAARHPLLSPDPGEAAAG